MAVKTRDMTRGKPVGHIVTFALPLMLGNIFQQLYMVVDTMVVGKALGVSALAALGAVDWLSWMMLGLTQGMMQGFAIPMAQAFGAKEEGRLRRVVGCSAVLSVVCAALFVLMGQLIARPVLSILHTPEAIVGDALTYLRVIFYGLPVVVAYNLFACILRSMGDGGTPLRAMVAAAFLNIGLDLLFVLVFHWGIAGAALATVIAQAFSGLFCLYFLLKNPMLRLSRQDFALNGAMVMQLFRLGTPMGIQNVMIAIGGMILQSVVNGFGVLFLAGYTASNKLYGILEMASTSYGYAMITYVGQNLGAGEFGRIRKGYRSAMVIAIGTSVVVGGLMILCGRTVLSWFISGTPEEAAITMKAGYHYLVVMSAALPALYVLHVSRSATQGMGNTVLPMVSGVTELVVRTAFAVILPISMGGEGVFYAEVLAWFGADLVLIPSYYSTLHKQERLWNTQIE